MAALPPNLNTPPATGANPALQNPVENKQENQDQISTPNQKESFFPRKIRNTFNIGEMLLALPLLANSFVLQADNISEQTKEFQDTGAVGYVGNTFETLSSVFKALINKFVAGGKDINDIETNRSADLLQNFSKRIYHPKISEEVISLLFNARRIVFNFWPNIFTVPSAEHDPLNVNKNIAHKGTATAYGILASVAKPLVRLSSLFAAITTVPSHLMGSYFTYTGNKDAYDATKYFNRISELFTPLLSNLSSLLSVSKSYIDSYLYNRSKFVTQGSFNVNWTNMIQGLAGAVTSVPYFFSILGKFRDVVQEKDPDLDFKFSKNLKTLADNIIPGLTPYLEKIRPGFDVDIFLKNFKARTEKLLSGSDDIVKNFLNALYNANPFTKKIFSSIRPSDSVGNVQALADSHTFDADDSSDYAFGFIRKSAFFKEVFDWLHPIQSMLMLLPNALVTPQDAYVKDNSKRFGRRLDRLFGFNSMLLSLPNYLIYSASTRIPQLLLKSFEYKERQYQIDRENRQRQGLDAQATTKVSGYQAYQNTLSLLKRLPLLGSKFLAEKLESLGIDETTFIDETEFRSVYESLDKSARKQEASVKASELVGATRIGFRTLLEKGAQKGSGIFFAKRDAFGFTDDERTRKGFYESIGKFKNIVGKIPVAGWIAAPLIEVFRKIYKVDTGQRRHVASAGAAQSSGRDLLQSLQQAAANKQAPGAPATVA